jgi:cytochrome c oxidase assembly protein subunit 15
MSRWTRFQVLALASAVGAFALMVAGGLVTQTDSGRGCPDWPLCHGQVIPDFGDPATAIEWTHRTIAVSVGLIVLAMTVFAWRDRRDERRILFSATATVALVVVQASLGGAVVLSNLNTSLVVVHLSVASAFFAMAVTTAILAFVLPPSARAGQPATAPARPDAARE